MKQPDPRFMREAIRLARRGLGRTCPNPAVGAVLVKGTRIIGRGFHRECGGPHAEIEAIAAATAPPRGADLYVTLEPCGHQGRTPPCSRAILEAGIRRVFYGCRDPNPKTRGKGLRYLRRAGVAVAEGPLEEAARHLNGPYLKWVTQGVPLVTAKWAMSLDGKIGTRRRQSQWITGREARRIAHTLRNEADAVLVGTETVLADDPELTCRTPGGRTPVRVLVDRQGRIPLKRRIFSTLDAGPVLLYTSRAGVPKARALAALGVDVAVVPCKAEGLRLHAVLRDLARRGLHHLLVEGGGAILGSMFDDSLVDRVVVFAAPTVIGGEAAVVPVAGRGVQSMDAAVHLDIRRFRRAGRDFVFWADVVRG